MVFKSCAACLVGCIHMHLSSANYNSQPPSVDSLLSSASSKGSSRSLRSSTDSSMASTSSNESAACFGGMRIEDTVWMTPSLAIRFEADKPENPLIRKSIRPPN